MSDELTIGILSWRSPKTLRHTLESYATYNLFPHAEKLLLFVQEISDADLEVANDFHSNVRPFNHVLYSPENIGIADAYRALVENTETPLFMFLEDDWELLREPTIQLNDAKQMLIDTTIDVARFRDRENPGAPLWSKQFEGNEMSKPEFLLESMHWTDPTRFGVITSHNDWYIALAKYANWTNNPHMARTEWLKEFILPRIGGDIEKGLQDWWREQNFLVAQSRGLFTHNRLAE